MAHLNKAKDLFRQRICDWPQILRYADLALKKLMPLGDRSLAGIEILDEVQAIKYSALNFMGRDKECLECATERYNQWAGNFMRNPRTVEASFPLIDSLIKNRELAQAKLIAGTVYEMVMHPMSHDIPENLQQPLLATAAIYLADTIYRLDGAGEIPFEEKKKAGEEAISLARKAVEVAIQQFGAESEQFLQNVDTLARLLDHFNDFDDDEALRLFEESKVIYVRKQGNTSLNVAAGEENLGRLYNNRARRALAARDVDRTTANLVLARTHFLEAARVFRINNHTEKANTAAKNASNCDDNIAKLAR